MPPELKTALVRGLIAAAVSAGGAFFTTLGLGLSMGEAGIAAGSAAFVVLSTRFGGEGTIDSKRANSGG